MVQRTNAVCGGRESVSVMKGEVDSSILSGSTTFHVRYSPFGDRTAYIQKLNAKCHELPRAVAAKQLLYSITSSARLSIDMDLSRKFPRACGYRLQIRQERSSQEARNSREFRGLHSGQRLF